MPRPQRRDLVPLIQIPNFAEARLQANRALTNRGLRANIYQVGTNQTPYCKFYDRLDRIQADLGPKLRKHNANDILRVIAGRIEMAEFDLLEQNVRNNADTVTGRLTQIGCRAFITHEEIATALGMSVKTVERGIRCLKEADIVVNWGPGWIEICASLIWRGSETLRVAYLDIQQTHPKHPLNYVVVG